MIALQRKLVIMTSMGKKYSGMVDLPSESFRTTDLLNSSNIFWRNPNEKCYENAILMYDARLFIDENMIYKKFKKIQIKRSEIFYFYDEMEMIGDEMEKKRASSMAQNIQEQAQRVHIITKTMANSFYDISGLFFGLFRKKSKDNFVPFTDVVMWEIFKKESKWTKKQYKFPHGFIGINNEFIEAITFG